MVRREEEEIELDSLARLRGEVTTLFSAHGFSKLTPTSTPKYTATTEAASHDDDDAFHDDDDDDELVCSTLLECGGFERQ